MKDRLKRIQQDHVSQFLSMSALEWFRFFYIAMIGALILVYVVWRYWLSEHGDEISLASAASDLVLVVLYFMAARLMADKKWDWILWTALMVVGVLVGIFLSVAYWEELHGSTQAGGPQDSPSTTIRNLALVIGGIVAVLLAVWRSIVSERQADTARESLLNERYQKGAEMLGSKVLSVRLGGIYALERLVAEYPELYHIQVMKLFCAFVRYPPEDRVLDSGADSGEPRTDIQAVMDGIGARGKGATRLEDQEFRLDLRRVQLRRATLGRANMSNARLSWANLREAALGQANLSKAILNQADLSGATLGGTKLIGSSLHRAVLPSAVFWMLRKPGPLRFITYQDALREGEVLTADLSAARFDHSDMSGASLQGCDLSGANLENANLTGANLSDANLVGARLAGANLSGAILSENGEVPAKGLTQAQLNQACADADNPPTLDGVVDAVSCCQLDWLGGSCEEE